MMKNWFTNFKEVVILKKFISFLLAFAFLIQSSSFVFADEDVSRCNRSHYGYSYSIEISKCEDTSEAIVAVVATVYKGLYLKGFYCSQVPELEAKVYKYADLIDSIVKLENTLGKDNLEKLSDVIFKNEKLADTISESDIIAVGVSRDCMPIITKLHKSFLKAEKLFSKL